jgi:hypothetical protein
MLEHEVMKMPSEYKAKQVKPLLISESARDSEVCSVIFPITVEECRDVGTASSVKAELPQ